MEYDKDYFLRRLAESQKKYQKASSSEKAKMQYTAKRLADKARSESLVKLNIGEEFFFFYGSKSIFSQWYECNFKIDDLQFTCTEQYMMYRKALLFSDRKSADKIIESGYNPKLHKDIGRKVNGFAQDVWDCEKENIVYEGNYYKFTQNPDLKKELIDTHPKILVETSPTDRIWGIGLDCNNFDRFNIENWKGDNLLGFILTRLRQNLQK